MRLKHSKLTHIQTNRRLEHFADKQNHINGIENFWNQVKRHLRRYNGIGRQNFHLFLKECEWSFNYGAPDRLLKTLRDRLKPYTQK